MKLTLDKLQMFGAAMLLISLTSVSYDIPIGNFFLTPADFAALALIIICVFSAITVSLKKDLTTHRLIFWAWLFILSFSTVVFLSAIFDGNFGRSLRVVIGYFIIPIFASLVLRFGNEFWSGTVTKVAFVIGCLLLLRILGYFPRLDFERAGNSYFESSLISGNTMFISARGEYGILLILFTLSIFVQSLKNRIRLTTFWITLCLIVLCVLATFSRSTWIAFMMLMLIFIISKVVIVNSVRNSLFRSYAAVVFLVFSLVLLYGALSDFILWLVKLRNTSVYDRVDQYTVAVQHLLENPLGGGSELLLEQFGHSIHNAFLALGISYGIFALAVYITFLAWLIIGLCAFSFQPELLKSERQMSGLFIGALVACIVEMSLYPQFNSMVGNVLIGISLGNYARISRAGKRAPISIMSGHSPNGT